jgi:uncharacterized membrane protein
VLLYGSVVAVALTSALCLSMAPAPFLPVPVHRGLHLVGMVLLMGNALSGAVWLALADASRSLRRLQFSLAAINRLDVWITAPASMLLVVNGAALAGIHGGVFKPLWLQWGVGLFGAAGVLWGSLLVPMQLRLEHACRQVAGSDDVPPPSLRRPLVRYFVAGGTVGALLLAALWVMVLRPV